MLQRVEKLYNKAPAEACFPTLPIGALMFMQFSIRAKSSVAGGGGTEIDFSCNLYF